MEILNMQSLNEILTELENVDNTTKNKVENELVSIGEAVVPELVNKLQVVRGIKRGVVAMTLIRLGDASVKYEWVAISNQRNQRHGCISLIIKNNFLERLVVYANLFLC